MLIIITVIICRVVHCRAEIIGRASTLHSVHQRRHAVVPRVSCWTITRVDPAGVHIDSGAHNRSTEVFIRVERGRFEVVKVLARVGTLIFAALDEPEEAGCQKGTKYRPQPIDPVFGWKRGVGNAWAKAASRVERTASVVNA